MKMTLDFKNITYSYDGLALALDDVSVVFGPGLHLLLGPNGAGKSTLLKAGAGLLDPRSGKCFLEKEVMACHDPHAVKHVFLLSDSMCFPLPTIADMAKLHAPFYPRFSAEALQRNLDAFSLSDTMRIDNLSPGNRRKANVAYALALGTEILMLDEPANGLDMASKDILTSMLVAAAEDGERTIIVATHTIQEMRNIFDSVTILREGRMAFSASVADIMDCVAFISAPTKAPDALFFREGVDGPNQIVPADDMAQTDPDLRLLYLAVTSSEGFTLPNRNISELQNPDSQI